MVQQVVNGIYDNPEKIVGNCSDVLGECSLVKIHVLELRYFPIIDQSDLLPVNPEVNESVERPHLRGGAFGKIDDAKIA